LGYTHYWHRPAVIEQDIFKAIRSDFERLILPLADNGVELAGGLGEGPPDLTDQVIRFNGLTHCRHPKNEEISIPYPTEDAEGVGPSATAIADDAESMVTRIRHRCCDGRCSYETFSVPRCLDLERREPDEEGRYIEFVKTGFRPYDVAATAALIIGKRHLKNSFMISSNGGDHQWADARRLCQRVLGYGDWFGIVEEQIVEEWPGNPPTKRDVLLRTLIELDPAALA
jgi:hypothetical protein